MLIKYGSHGEDVLKYKKILFYLGYLKSFTHNRFLDDSKDATIAFQKTHVNKKGKALQVDGKIGSETSWALDKAYAEYLAKQPATPAQVIVQYLDTAKYPDIDKTILALVNADLQDESKKRIAAVQEALKHVWPTTIYVFGANLFNTNLKVNVPTVAYVEARAKARPAYFSGGKKAFLIKCITNAINKGKKIECGDCSGSVIGVWRFLKYVAASFDTTASGLYHSYCKAIKKAALRPGDLVFEYIKGGIPHVGMYIGAGYTWEAAGAFYGAQVAKLNDHIIINHDTGKKKAKSPWRKFGSPKIFN
jgi:cell wall-associated NlpC family hydrolase